MIQITEAAKHKINESLNKYRDKQLAASACMSGKT